MTRMQAVRKAIALAELTTLPTVVVYSHHSMLSRKENQRYTAAFLGREAHLLLLKRGMIDEVAYVFPSVAFMFNWSCEMHAWLDNLKVRFV